MKLYGCGLPRTGTTSLSHALEILGYRVVHYCPITNAATKSTLKHDLDAYVSSELLLNVDLSHGKWIILHRDNWYESMINLGQDLCQWQTHIEKYNDIKNVQRDNVLHYSITQGWDNLCEFLNKRVPCVDFPKLNTR